MYRETSAISLYNTSAAYLHNGIVDANMHIYPEKYGRNNNRKQRTGTCNISIFTI